MRRWWVLALLLLALAGLQLRFWWGDGGWDQAGKLQARAAAQRAENARLQPRNDALEAEVEDLKSGEAAVEERARSELGMIKPGEVFYRVVENGSSPQRAPLPSAPPATAAPAADPVAAPVDADEEPQ